MKGKFKSLKIILSSIVVLIIVVMITFLIVMSYQMAYKAVEKVYENQLSNFNEDLMQQLERYYTDQMTSAQFLASHERVIEAADTGNGAIASTLLVNFFKSKDIYEDVILSTIESNPRVITSGSTNATGIRWGGTGYDENIDLAQKGQVYVSQPNKSPATGRPVVLVTAPVKRNGSVIGIIGLSCDINKLALNLVKNLKIGKTGYAVFIRDDGVAFAHPDESGILKIDFSKFDFWKDIQSSPDGTMITYQWEGRDKLLTFKKNPKRKVICAITLYFDDINEDARSMALVMILIGIIGMVLSAIAIYLFIAKRLEPLDECKAIMGEMADGNLVARYNGRQSQDEIGDISRAMNHTLEQFERLISEVIVSSQNLAQAVEQISSGNQNLSQRTSEQASSLEEIASTIEEATAAINQNADNSVEAKTLSEKSSDLAVEGGKLVNEAVDSINEINETSKKIGEIITVVNEISFQTNLLALNAAVEAARAGEQGRGFAVVAGEVRNLAQRSGSAAKEIGELIKNSVNMIENGTEKVNRSGEALEEIIKSVRNVSQVIAEITEASNEQKSGIQQINIAITEMDSMTQQNAALVEETASASEEMANQAQELLAMMKRFQVKEELTRELTLHKHKEVHLRAAEMGKKESKKAQKAIHKDAGIKEKSKPDDDSTLKEHLSSEGFEEF
ncbi:MAG TPA: methyl-accepting chemotaxis protein [Spirochaetota bacterium]|nr:methyl-accepting chemotaxis protein [Spirochaetota bacterium]HPR46852.1 methyl-accepting chemotaxis protein [Spirochaetota bacterium]